MKEKLERYQIWIYVLALMLGIGIGFAYPAGKVLFEAGIWFLLGTLLYTMFLQVPLASLNQAIKHRRFMLALLLVNFFLVPIVVWFLTRWLPADRPLLLGVFLVLLTPCIDYVIPFTQMGRGEARLTLAATPMLLLAQMLCLPFYLWLFLGAEAVAVMSAKPFLQAFVGFIVIPFGLSLASEVWASQDSTGARWKAAMSWLPVPLTGLTLLVVVASQTTHMVGFLQQIGQVIPVYASFVVVMPLIAHFVARRFALSVGASRALAFSSTTRNSLVVLPLALSLPNPWAITAVAIVTQTFVELLGLLVLTRAIPLLISQPHLGRNDLNIK